MATAPGMVGYYSEMGEKRPEAATIDARLCHGGKHWYLRTPLALKTGRSVVFLKTYTARDLVPQAQHLVGWHSYRVTKAAFEKIKAEHCVAVEILLD